MGLKKIQILTGTVLSLGVVAVSSDMARANTHMNMNQTQMQMQESQINPSMLPDTGTVRNVQGNMLSVELPDGRMEMIQVSQPDVASYTIGERVFVSEGRIVQVNAQGMVVERGYTPDQISMMTTGYMSQMGTVRGVTGSTASVTLNDGSTRMIGLSRTQAERLVPGTQVYISDNRILEPNEVNAMLQQRAATPTTLRTQTVIQETEQQVQAPTAPVTQPAPATTQTAPMTQPTMQQQTTPAQQQQVEFDDGPVRGMW